MTKPSSCSNTKVASSVPSKQMRGRLVKRYKEGLLTTVASVDGKYVFKPGRNYYIVYL